MIVGYPYTVGYKEVLLTTLNIGYTAYQSPFVWFTKYFGPVNVFPLQTILIPKTIKRSANDTKHKLYRVPKTFCMREKFSLQTEQFLGKKFSLSQQKKNSHGKGKILPTSSALDLRHYQKEARTQVIFCEVCKIFNNTCFLQNSSGGCF